MIVTENMFGDILTDEAAVLAGSLGLLPERVARRRPRAGSTSRSTARRPTSPGRGIANPIGTILSAAMLLRHSLGLLREADLVERAVASVITAGARTADMGAAPGEALSTTAMGDRIRRAIASKEPR